MSIMSGTGLRASECARTPCLVLPQDSLPPRNRQPYPSLGSTGRESTPGAWCVETPHRTYAIRRARQWLDEPMTAETFNDKVALVTGASRGIGRAISLALAAAGARVALLARSRDELAEVAKDIGELGGTALVTRADVSNPDEVRAAAIATIDEFGGIDILVNNAGVVWPLAPTIHIDPADWAAAMSINVIGVVTLTLAVLPQMLDRGWGRIVNISSSRAANPAGLIGGNAYATSKAALEAHTLNLAAELSGTGVTVNAYRPGSVNTSMHDWIRRQPPEELGESLHKRFVQMFEEGKLMPPEQTARVLLSHLLSDATGEVWKVSDA
jgi:NAD(P)-dependent dehydrogenase (short-subunit alcohol dehydrogenase family)